MSKSSWTPEQMPSLEGKTFVVTGANSGIGFEATRVFVRHGARVILACRSPEKTAPAIDQLRSETPGAKVEFMALDLASLASIRVFAAAINEREPRIDALINNAGVMAIPLRRTEDGFEMQIGTNHLGHFALTGLLFDKLCASAPSRIVSVASSAHRMGKINFDDFNWQRGYSKWPAYGQTKLANLLFIYELDRRLRARNLLDVRAVAAHPGYAATNLQATGPKMEGSAFGEWLMKLGNSLLSQSSEMGAQPTEFAATSPEALSGDYIGPSGVGELAGAPKKVKSNPRSYDQAVAKRLWSLSEELTGVRFLD